MLKHKKSGLILKEAVLRGQNGDIPIWISAKSGDAVWGIDPNDPEWEHLV